MMATTAASERTAIELLGTIHVEPRGARASGGTASMSSHGSAMGIVGAIVERLDGYTCSRPSWRTRRRASNCVHQGNIVGGDHDGSAHLLSSDEQAQETLTEIGIDVAGRLVGQQKLRPRYHGTRDRGALLFAARQNGRQRAYAIAEADPVQQFHHL